MDIPILYEDDALLVINKPPGLVVNRAQSVKGETVQDWVEKKVKSQKSPARNATQSVAGGKVKSEDWKDFCDRAGIVHRIDKETSGILLIAKTPEAFGKLQRQFKAREVKKTYLALVHGKLVPQEGEIRAPLGRLPWNRQRFGIVPGGKEAVTRYARISNAQFPISNETISLVELYPETGRTHQIRVHLKYINHPIVGDYLYAGRKVSRRDRAGDAPRVMLHAAKISFSHPSTGKSLAMEAPIPDDMMKIINPTNTTNTTNTTNICRICLFVGFVGLL